MLRLRDIMTRDVLTLSPETTLRDAVDLLATRHVGGAPVVAGAHVVGVVSMSDLLDFQASASPVTSDHTEPVEWGDGEEQREEWDDESEPSGTFFSGLWTEPGADADTRFDTSPAVERDLLEEHTVSEVMERRVRALRPDAPVETAAEVMARAGIHRVLVMEGEELRGIVTTMDVTRAVADHRLEVRRFVFGHPIGGTPRGGLLS